MENNITKQIQLAKKKKTIMKMRLNGATLTEIAAAVGSSKQSVSCLMNYFVIPVDEDLSFTADETCLDQIPMKTQYAACYAKIDGLSENEIIKKLGITREQLHLIYHKITDRRHAYASKYVYYPHLTKWRLDNNVSIATFANQCGIAEGQMVYILSGRRDMPMDLMEKISSITGLPYDKLKKRKEHIERK